MQEDVMGTQAVAGRSYATCSECGSVFIRHAARVEPGSVIEGSHSEYTELCPDCDALDRQGEQPVVGDDPR